MIGGMLDAVRGCLKEEMRMDLVSNNLANSTVIGFKKDVISFQEMLEEASQGPTSEGSGDLGIEGSSVIKIQTDFSQGDTRGTGNPLDLAIFGEGFFKVDTPEGIRYTRKGNFSLDTEGFMITQDGYRVMGEGGSINISGNEIIIDGRGTITADGDEVGRIAVVNFEDSAALVKEGRGFYRNQMNFPEVAPAPETRIQQEYVELSNVNVAEEMILMIQSLRAFESYQKSIQILDGLNSRAINEVGRLR
jgi:flagellar basal-body rod protein FlgF